MSTPQFRSMSEEGVDEALLVIRKAAVVKALQWQLDRIEGILRDGYEGRFSHAQNWSVREWIAEQNGQITVIDIMSDGLCHDIGASVRDALPGFKGLCEAIARVNNRIYSLRTKEGMGFQ